MLGGIYSFSIPNNRADVTEEEMSWVVLGGMLLFLLIAAEKVIDIIKLLMKEE